MTSSAMGFCRVMLAHISAPYVFNISNNLKMIRIYTATIAALMVQNHSFGNLAFVLLI